MAAGGLPFDYMNDMKTDNSNTENMPMSAAEWAADQAAKEAAEARAAAAEAEARERAVQNAKIESEKKHPVMPGITVRNNTLGSLSIPSFRRSTAALSVTGGGKKRRKRKTVKKLKKRKLKAGKSKKARISLNSITRRARSLRYRSRYNRGSTRTIRTKKR